MKQFTLSSENRAEIIPRIGQYLKSLNCDNPQYVRVDDKKETRRSRQNRLYWKWVGIIGSELGYDREPMHAALVVEILGTESIEVMGRTITKPKDTHTLSVGEFSSYMEAVNRFAAGMNIMLPMEEI